MAIPLSYEYDCTTIPEVPPAHATSRVLYSLHTLNNPLKYTDPSGHCENLSGDSDYDDYDCWQAYNQLSQFMDENPNFASARERVGFDLAEAADWDRTKILDNLNYYKKLIGQPSPCWSGSSSSCSSARWTHMTGGDRDPDAFLLGFSLDSSLPSPFTVGAIGGIELLINPSSKQITLFLYGGGESALVSPGQAEISAYFGSVYNLDDNSRYSGPFITTTLSATAGGGLMGGRAVTPSDIVNLLNPEDVYTDFIGATGGVGGGLTVAATNYAPLVSISWGDTWPYIQIHERTREEEQIE